MDDLHKIKRRLSRHSIDIGIMKSQYQSIKEMDAEILRRLSQNDAKLDYAIKTICEMQSDFMRNCEKHRVDVAERIIKAISASENSAEKKFIKIPSTTTSFIVKTIFAIIFVAAAVSAVAFSVSPPISPDWIKFIFGL